MILLSSVYIWGIRINMGHMQLINCDSPVVCVTHQLWGSTETRTHAHTLSWIKEDRNRCSCIVQLAAETTGSSSLNPSLCLRSALSMTDSLRGVVYKKKEQQIGRGRGGGGVKEGKQGLSPNSPRALCHFEKQSKQPRQKNDWGVCLCQHLCTECACMYMCVYIFVWVLIVESHGRFLGALHDGSLGSNRVQSWVCWPRSIVRIKHGIMNQSKI